MRTSVLRRMRSRRSKVHMSQLKKQQISAKLCNELWNDRKCVPLQQTVSSRASPHLGINCTREKWKHCDGRQKAITSRASNEAPGSMPNALWTCYGPQL